MKTKNKRIVPFKQDTNAVTPQCCVVLEEVGAEKNPVINTVREVTGVSPIEAKALVDAVESAPQIIIRQVSASRADEICLAFEGLGAKAKAVSESDDPGAAKTLKLALRRRAAAKKKAATREVQRNAVLDLFRDKVKSEFLGIEALLEVELQCLREKLEDSGVAVSLLPEPKVTVNGNEGQAVMAVSVIL